jgi:hypothetical protein
MKEREHVRKIKDTYSKANFTLILRKQFLPHFRKNVKLRYTAYKFVYYC